MSEEENIRKCFFDDEYLDFSEVMSAYKESYEVVKEAYKKGPLDENKRKEENHVKTKQRFRFYRK